MTNLGSDEVRDPVMEGGAVHSRHSLHQQLDPLLLRLVQAGAGDHHAHHGRSEHGVVELRHGDVLRQTGEQTHRTWGKVGQSQSTGRGGVQLTYYGALKLDTGGHVVEGRTLERVQYEDILNIDK